MRNQITVACLCGRCRITLSGQPILGSECHCDSCRRAADAYEALPGAPKERSATNGVAYVLWRKDRVGAIQGEELLASHRLKPDATTRRVVATCCNAPMFLDFAPGHWLSLNAARFPDGHSPAIDSKSSKVGFMLRLLGAWIAMGFRNPPVAQNVTEVASA